MGVLLEREQSNRGLEDSDLHRRDVKRIRADLELVSDMIDE